jgi:hypothetical protein
MIRVLNRVCVTLAIVFSMANVVNAANVIIENEFVRAGVNETSGTLGSGGSTRPGLQYDNTGTSTWPCNSCQGDYLTPGAPFEGFTVRLEDGTGTLINTYTNNNAGGATISGGAWVGTPTAASATWRASNSEFIIQHDYSLPAGQKYIDITTGITANVAVGKLWFGRFIDPDAMPMPGDTSATDNVLGYGAIPRANVVFSEATVSRYALGLYTAASTGKAGISMSWSTNPRDYYANTSPYFEPLLDADGKKVPVDATRPWMGFQSKLDADGNRIPVLYGNGDHTVGLGFVAENVAVGDIVTFKYAYIFGPSAFGAATSAVAGGAGGGTAGSVPGGGTLVDVGSATDSAAGGGTTPGAATETGRTTATVITSDTFVADTSLPVIIGSITHHVASETSTVQTIARENTTSVTTPGTRTVVSVDRTTISWSDGTTTTSDSASTTATTLSNHVANSSTNDSLSGRIDQYTVMGQVSNNINRMMNHNIMRQDGIKYEHGTLYINGGLIDSKSGGYTVNARQYGFAVDRQVRNDLIVGVQFNHVNSTMNGTDSSGSMNKSHFGLYSLYTRGNFLLQSDLGIANNSYRANRTIETVFNNASNTSGNDVWLSNRVYYTGKDVVRPFAGITVGRGTIAGYTETGSIQSARTVAGTNSNMNYAEAGVQANKQIGKINMFGELSATTDGFTTVAAGAGWAVRENGVLTATVSSHSKDGVTSNRITGGVKFRW